MSEQDLVDSESADKSGVFSFRTSEVTKKRIQEAIKGTGKKADEFMLQAISTMQEEESRVDLPSEWKALEQQVRSILPILNTTWHQTATILQQERVEVEKLKSRVQEINIKHAEKLIEIEKHEKELEKKLEVALKNQKDAEENAENYRIRSEQATSTFNVVKNRVEELEIIIMKQKPAVDKCETVEVELSMLKKEIEYKITVQTHELENEKKRLSLECQEKLINEKAKHIAENEDYQKKVKELNNQIDLLKKENETLKK